jgi:hypothetical protein
VHDLRPSALATAILDVIACHIAEHHCTATRNNHETEAVWIRPNITYCVHASTGNIKIIQAQKKRKTRIASKKMRKKAMGKIKQRKKMKKTKQKKCETYANKKV